MAAATVERLPPADEAAERAVIGALLVSPDALGDVAELLTPADFYRPAHGELFAAALALRGQGRPVDHLTVSDHLGDRLERLGGLPYLVRCVDELPTAANAAYWAEIVAEKAIRRRLVELSTRIAQAAYEPTDRPGVELVDQARALIEDVPLGPRARTAGRQLRVTLASEVVMRRLRFLWQGRIVLGALNLLAGREGLGKSTVAVDLAAQVTRGCLPGELYGQPRPVIYVHTEDARDLTLVPRLHAAGADLDLVVFLDITRGEHEAPLVLPLDTALVEQEIRARAAALVVLDAATSVIDGALDGDRDRQMRQGLEPLGQLAARTGAAVLGIVHFGKRESSDTGKLILGSIAWSQVARSVLAVARDDHTGHLVLSATKANLAPGDTASVAATIVSATVPTDDGPTSVGRVEWMGETEQRAQDLLAASADPDERSRIEEAVDWLRDYFAEPGRGGAAAAREVLRAGERDGFNERLMQRARKRAGVRTGKGRGGWTWSLDPTGPDQDDKESTL